MSKPLISRLLLENSNKPANLSLETLKEVLVPKQNQNRSVIKLQTLKKSEDIREQARQITELKTINSVTAKVLFRKVTKGIDQKDFVIAQQELRIKQLERRVVQLEPRKRRKVQTSPNSKFVSIKAIIRA